MTNATSTTKRIITPRLMQLYALRSQLEALIVSEEMDVAVTPDPTACPRCGASDEKIVDASTMGQRRQHCTVCDVEWPA